MNVDKILNIARGICVILLILSCMYHILFHEWDRATFELLLTYILTQKD